MVRNQGDSVSEGVCSAHVPLQASLLPERLSGTAGCQGKWQCRGSRLVKRGGDCSLQLPCVAVCIPCLEPAAAEPFL